MKLPRIPLGVAVGLWLGAQVAAQDNVLKPFRPDAGKPAGDSKPPAESRPTEAAPLKPFRQGEEIPKAQPVRPKAEDAPKAVPVRKPEPPIESKPKESEPESPSAKPKTSTETAESEMADIVVKPGAAPTSPDQVQLQFADGHYAKKQWREAAPEYETYLQRYPKAPAADQQAAMYRLAECYRQTGALNNAKANYEAILSKFNGGEFLGYAAYRLASLLYDEKDYRAALPIYRRATVRLTQPTLVNASKFFVGRCLEATGQKREARVQYEELANTSEGNPYRDASKLSVGRLLEESKDYDGALKWLLPLSKESSNTQIRTEALTRSGLLQLEVKQPEAALATLTAALELPEAAASKQNLIQGVFRALYEKKDYKGALAKYESGAANELPPEGKLNVMVIIANSHRELGNRDASMALYDQIARDFAGTPQARDAAYARLLMLYETGDARLLEEVNKFLVEHPSAPQGERVSLMKGEALFKAGDFENAAAIYEIIVEKARGLSGQFKGEAAFKLGWCRMQLRQYEQAAKTFIAFLKDYPVHPKVPTALAQLGAAQMQLKQFHAALKSFEELTSKHPKAKEREYGLENLALIHGQLGDTAQMAAAFEVLLRDYPETAAKAKAHFWIGHAAFGRKDYKKAAPHLDQARKLDKEQFFEKASMAVVAACFNMEDLAATEREIDYYRSNGGKNDIPIDVTRWLGHENFEAGKFDKAMKYLALLVIQKEAATEDFLMLARSRAKLGEFEEAVKSYDSYLAVAKQPIQRILGIIEKAETQTKLKDWDGAEKTVKEGLEMAPEGRLNGELRLLAGRIEEGRGKLRKAIQIYEAIPVTLEDDDVCPRALERAADLYRKLGEDGEVKRLENLLRSKYPEYLHKKKALSRQ